MREREKEKIAFGVVCGMLVSAEQEISAVESKLDCALGYITELEEKVLERMKADEDLTVADHKFDRPWSISREIKRRAN